jgi:hypothetical protein
MESGGGQVRGFFIFPSHPSRHVAPCAVVLHQSHTSFSSYAGRDFVEVLTKCRVQHLSRGEVRFVAAEREATGRRFGISPRSGLSGQTCRKLAIGNAGGFPYVHCAAINNRSRDNGTDCFSPRAHNPVWPRQLRSRCLTPSRASCINPSRDFVR